MTASNRRGILAVAFGAGGAATVLAIVLGSLAQAAAAGPTLSVASIWKINTMQSSWKAAPNERTAQPREESAAQLSMSYEQFLEHMKERNRISDKYIAAPWYIYNNRRYYVPTPNNERTHHYEINAGQKNAPYRADLPQEFDSREKWPQCRKVIEHIRDQGKCGSCWAFGAAEAMSDRECIHNTRTLIYSAEDIMSCSNNSLSMCGGCTGGLPWCAWKYWTLYGVVGEDCAPYTATNSTTPACTRKCRPSSRLDWEQSKHYGATSESFSGEQDMKAEIAKNGPIEALMIIYEDFYGYKTGIYYHTLGGITGVHAVKIIGWGTQDGIPYWTVVNSWGPDWGENGTFRIRRGAQECMIEVDSFAGLPKPLE